VLSLTLIRPYPIRRIECQRFSGRIRGLERSRQSPNQPQEPEPPSAAASKLPVGLLETLYES